jgi:hypothetical protein
MKFNAAAILAVALFLRACGPLTNADDIVVADPARAVADARKLIQDTRKMGREKNEGFRYLDVSELPASLRIPDLRYCRVAEDRLALILARNPDNDIGARIWSADSARDHRDQKTRYPEIFFFHYNNDTPESPDNIP